MSEDPKEARVPARVPAVEALRPYLASPTKLMEEHARRVWVTYRCKRRGDFLGMIVATPNGVVIHAVRGEREWQGENPQTMTGYLPELSEDNGELLVGMGGCSSSSVRSKPLREVWKAYETARESNTRTVVRM